MTRWPLTGRSAELRSVTGALLAGGGVVIAGGAGAGKTRLAREALMAVEAAGEVTVRWMAATEVSRSVPLGALAPLLPPPRPGTGEPTGLDLIRHAQTELLAQAERLAQAGRRLVLGVDDTHLLDEVSAVVCHQLAVTFAVPLLATVRSGAPVPDAVAALWKDHLPRVDLGPLSREQTAGLLAAALEGPVDGVTAERVWSLTQGNPLFLHELVEGARQDGGLVRRRGMWSWRGRPGANARLTELVRARLGVADVAERRVLELLAFAEPLDLDLLYGLALGEVVAAVDRKRLISVEHESGRPRVRLAHPLYGEVIRANTGVLEARDRRRLLARALDPAAGVGPREVLRLAELCLDAGEPADPQVLIRAAEYAMARSDAVLGERLAGAAIEGGGGFDARLCHAHALMWQRRLQEAEEEFRALEQGAVTDSQRVRAALARAESLHWFVHRVTEAEAVVRAAEATITDEAARWELGGLRSCFHAFAGRMDQALEVANRVLDSPAAEESAVAWATTGATFAYGYMGQVTAARKESQRNRVLWERGPQAHQIPLTGARFDALWLGGELDEAQQLAEEYRERAVTEYSPLHSAIGAIWLGYVALSRGMPATARRWLLEAPAAMDDLDPYGELHLAHLALVQAHALLGDAVAAQRSLADARKTRRPGSRFHRPYESLAQAWAAAAAGDAAYAGKLARQGAEDAAGMKLPAVEAMALHTALRFGQSRSIAARLWALADTTDSRLVGAYAEHANALAEQDGAGLERAGGLFEDLGMVLLAAEAYAHAAHIWSAAGQRAAELGAAGRARALLESCEGARTPATDRLRPAVELTRRERDVAVLAAGGLARRAIAERLSISVRTVESHLNRIYPKLGISSRAELARALATRTGA